MDNRRSFMAWLAGFLGLGAIATPAIAAVPKKLEGFIVFFVNIGQLPPFKAEAFIDRLKDKWKKDNNEKSLINNWQVFWIPTRTYDTHAEFYPLSGKMDEKGRLEQIDGFFHEYADEVFHTGAAVDFDDPEVKARVIDYTLLMLGAPVVKIELDEQQINMAFDTAVHHIKNTGNAVNSVYLTEGFLKDGVLAFAKMMLGRVRSKWINPPGVAGHLDGPELLEEAREDLERWKNKLEEMM